MHAFITGHLADARIADIERELADVTLRAHLRAANGTRPARADAIAATLRRLASSWLPSLVAPSATAVEDVDVAPQMPAPRGTAGFVARL